jgi:HSP20 family protein
MTFKDYRDIIRQMERDMQSMSDDMFRGFFDLPVSGGRFWSPPVDIHETEDSLLVKCEIAGVRPADLQVSLSADDRYLTIAGMRKEPAVERAGRTRCHQIEIYFGPFERTVMLPKEVLVDRERLAAVYRDGFLIVTLPKSTTGPDRRARVIPITMGDDLISGSLDEAKMPSKSDEEES